MPMKVTLMQRDIVWADPQQNLRRASEAIASLEPTDLIVLPEMFATGFGGDPVQTAEPEEGGAVLTWMRQTAARHDCAVAGSVAVAVKETGDVVNRLYFVKPDGTVVHYDKHHLFRYGGEQGYAAGQERVVVTWRGVRFMLLVCYDLRFPAWNRCHSDYDCALYVASWPTARITQWAALLRARAIENQCYVVGVNRVGSDPVCDYPGDSVVVHPYGHALVLLDDKEQAATVDLDIDALYHFRERFPVLEEADTYIMRNN